MTLAPSPARAAGAPLQDDDFQWPRLVLAPTSPSQSRRRGVVGATRLVAGILALVIAVGVGAGWATGWRIHVMTTASMGRTAPVGTLVISRPVAPGTIRRGQIIVFHPPGQANVTFVHRVIRVVHRSDPAISTRGDLNGSVDPWTLHSADLIGRAVWRIPVLGYLIEMLPAGLAAVLAIILMTLSLRPERRRAARTLLGSIAAAGLLAYYQPLARVSLVAQTINHGYGVASVVPTGILPLRIQAVGGSHADLIPGQLGTVHHDHITDHGRFAMTAGIHLTGWWWLLLGVWAIPVLVSLWRPPETTESMTGASSPA